MSGAIYELKDNQARAAEPEHSVWLSASAGTGKTQVLSARVLRLLLEEGVSPGQLLCLTFTKAGAAEMATRINSVLARWVRLPAVDLAYELKAIGAPHGPAVQKRARTLFASVLDCPGGGLRIDTIHAFAQWLLAAFPEEAGLSPGVRVMDDREEAELAGQTLTDLALSAEKHDGRAREALAQLSIRLGPSGTQSWLRRCAKAHDLWFGPGAMQPPLDGRVHRLIGLPAEADADWLAAQCSNNGPAAADIEACIAGYRAWHKSKSAEQALAVIGDWRAGDGAARAALLGALHEALFMKNGKPKLPKNADDGFRAAHERAGAALQKLIETETLLAIAEELIPALTLGRQYALAWQAAKTREGLIEFDDQIREAARLLTRDDISGWIRYKFDRQFDHILVDEAQDTNAAQWAIIKALTEEFYAGEGQRGEALRTLFVVGDYKQAIFGFQGTSPENFRAAKGFFAEKINIAAQNALEIKALTPPLPLAELGLDRSYRTAQPVLDFVNEALAALGDEALGEGVVIERHIGKQAPGLVGLWPAISQADAEAEARQGLGEGAADMADGDDSPVLSQPEQIMAERIARQIKAWLDEQLMLHNDGKPRPIEPRDVMVLVRRRPLIASQVVIELMRAGVPVAGVDRMRLGAPLAVKDLMAALRFAAQPLDDLSLANLLVSPLGGWSQDDLLHYGFRPKGVRLWRHLRASREEHVVCSLARLGDLLSRADYETPAAMLHWIITGPWQGRRALCARLGSEANDPIDELLNAAIAYGAEQTASLHGFIRWFDMGEGELKRDAGQSANEVRVLTVHGAKGLEAPIVILADAAGDPRPGQRAELELVEEVPGGGAAVPLLPVPGAKRTGRIAEAAEAAKRAELREHWRLMYVALTRAREALFIGGALRKTDDGPPADSWYARLAPLFPEQHCPDPIWGETALWGSDEPYLVPGGAAPRGQSLADDAPPNGADEASAPLPNWAREAAGPEPRPPRPLTPSRAGEDLTPLSPLSEKGGYSAAAAQRGVIMHRLLERLPDIPPEARAAAGEKWLAAEARGFGAEEQAAMLARSLAVVNAPEYADIFSARAMAEVNLMAVVGEEVIAGTADRLLVRDELVQVIDFKTTMRPPERLADIPRANIAQMAAYYAALAVIYPGRAIEALLLYAHSPQLFALPRALLDAELSRLTKAEAN